MPFLHEALSRRAVGCVSFVRLRGDSKYLRGTFDGEFNRRNLDNRTADWLAVGQWQGLTETLHFLPGAKVPGSVPLCFLVADRSRFVFGTKFIQRVGRGSMQDTSCQTAREFPRRFPRSTIVPAHRFSYWQRISGRAGPHDFLRSSHR